MLQCVAVWCGVLQCGVECVAVCCSEAWCVAVCVAVWCGVLQCVSDKEDTARLHLVAVSR